MVRTKVSSFRRPNAANMSAMLDWPQSVQYKYNHTVEWEYHIDGPLGRNKIFYDTILHYFFRVPCRTPLFPSPSCCPLHQNVGSFWLSHPFKSHPVRRSCSTAQHTNVFCPKTHASAGRPPFSRQNSTQHFEHVIPTFFRWPRRQSYCHFLVPHSPRPEDESRNISAIHQY